MGGLPPGHVCQRVPPFENNVMVCYLKWAVKICQDVNFRGEVWTQVIPIARSGATFPGLHGRFLRLQDGSNTERGDNLLLKSYPQLSNQGRARGYWFVVDIEGAIWASRVVTSCFDSPGSPCPSPISSPAAITVKISLAPWSVQVAGHALRMQIAVNVIFIQFWVLNPQACRLSIHFDWYSKSP